MLRACHRVLRPGGRLAFFVVHVRPGLTAGERAEVVENDPAFIESPRPYRELMAEAGFEAITEEDVSPAFRATSARWLEVSEALEPELRAALGDQVFEDKQARRRRNAILARAGLVGRALLTGVAA